MNQMVRFYGGVFHGEARIVDASHERISIAEGLPMYPTPEDDELAKFRMHSYRRLWLTLGDDDHDPFSVFVYEGWN